MASTGEKIAAELKALIEEGGTLLDATRKEDRATFVRGYHLWYTRALAVMRTLLPDREAEFRRLYEKGSKKEGPQLWFLHD